MKGKWYKIMLGLIKKMRLLITIVNASNHTNANR